MGSHRVRHDWSDLAAAAERPETAHFTLWGSVSSIRRLKCYWLQLGHWIAWVNIWKFPEQCPAHEKLSINDNCIYGHIQLIHFIVQQKLAPYCKATTPQLKKKKGKTGNCIIWGKQCAMLERVHGPLAAISQPERNPSPQCGNLCPTALTLSKRGQRQSGAALKAPWKMPSFTTSILVQESFQSTVFTHYRYTQNQLYFIPRVCKLSSLRTTSITPRQRQLYSERS